MFIVIYFLNMLQGISMITIKKFSEIAIKRREKNNNLKWQLVFINFLLILVAVKMRTKY